MSAFFDHPVLSAWIDAPAARAAFSWEAELAALLRFETALAAAEAEQGLIPAEAACRIAEVAGGFAVDLAALRARMRADGVVVPGLVAQLRGAAGADGKHLHVGATSQDAADSALMLRMSPLVADLAQRLGDLREAVLRLSTRFGERPLMARTRMRAALPIRVADRLAVWEAGLADAATGLDALTYPVQLAGPVGTLSELGERGPAVRAALAALLGLDDPGRGWHTTRAPIVAIGVAAEAVARATGRIGLDLMLMAQDGIDAAELAGGSSSAMPHKVNPVDAELVVALSRMASVQLGALTAAALHEAERSGVGWTLEWAALPEILHAADTSLVATQRLLGGVIRLGEDRPQARLR